LVWHLARTAGLNKDITMQHAWPWVVVKAAPAPLSQLVPGLQLVNDSLRLPFDAARRQHARAVRAGLLAPSLLESRDFEHTLVALEHLTLGPFARHV
jgi:hypothetical protein